MTRPNLLKWILKLSKMKVLFAFILILILGLIAHLFLPWWVIAIVCFLIGLAFIDKTKHALFIGFFAVFTLWGIRAFVSSYQNDFVLINRMSELLPIHNTWLIILLTALLGGLIGMMSTLSGYYLQTINNKPKRKFRWLIVLQHSEFKIQLFFRNKIDLLI